MNNFKNLNVNLIANNMNLTNAKKSINIDLIKERQQHNKKKEKYTYRKIYNACIAAVNRSIDNNILTTSYQIPSHDYDCKTYDIGMCAKYIVKQLNERNVKYILFETGLLILNLEDLFKV